MSSIACFDMGERYTGIAPGIWRAELSLIPKNISPNKKGEYLKEKLNLKFDEVTEGQLPFLFEVKYKTDSVFTIEIINGKERIEVKDIKFGRDRKTGKDTLIMRFPEFESYIKAICEGGIMEGEFVITSKENYRIPFTAQFGKDYRFSNLKKKPVMDITGSWETTFDINTDEPYKAIGDFQQKGNYLEGTFKTETGDYRFLEGNIEDSKIYLSCFDGTHAYLFEGKIQADKTINGSYRSGLSEPSVWEAKLNPNFKLRNPDSLTFLNKTIQDVNFSFPDPNGKIISPTKEEYNGKVKIIQLGGTWCPNCKDETLYLKELIKDPKYKDLAIMGLSFERHKDPEKANNAVKIYKKTLDIPWDIAVAGINKKEERSKSVPFLQQIEAFPTMIVLDKKNRVRKIHTGFAGPATNEFNSFKLKFGTFIESLINE